jgi:hypothetical protein
VHLGKRGDLVMGNANKSAHCQHNNQTARAVRAHHENFFYVRGAA